MVLGNRCFGIKKVEEKKAIKGRVGKKDRKRRNVSGQDVGAPASRFSFSSGGIYKPGGKRKSTEKDTGY